MTEKIINGFITNLGKYNEGYLIGEWVGFPIDDDELEKVLERIGINKEYEEYFLTDWSVDLPYCEFDEYENVAYVNELAEELEALDSWDLEKLEAILEVECLTLEKALSSLDSYEYYGGVTLEEYAEEIVCDCYNLPDFALRYFDFGAFARDLSYDGYSETENGVLYRG